jgi:hypothetical protein
MKCKEFFTSRRTQWRIKCQSRWRSPSLANDSLPIIDNQPPGTSAATKIDTDTHSTKLRAGGGYYSAEFFLNLHHLHIYCANVI